MKLNSRRDVESICSFIAEAPVAPPGYVTFRDAGDQSEGICNRDVTSPITELDGQSNSSRGVKFSSMSIILTNASAENMRYNVILCSDRPIPIICTFMYR